MSHDIYVGPVMSRARTPGRIRKTIVQIIVAARVGQSNERAVMILGAKRHAGRVALQARKVDQVFRLRIAERQIILRLARCTRSTPVHRRRAGIACRRHCTQPAPIAGERQVVYIRELPVTVIPVMIRKIAGRITDGDIALGHAHHVDQLPQQCQDHLR